MSNRLAPHRWNSEDVRAHLLNGGDFVSTKVQSLWGGFAQFALRDNVLEVAVGLMYALFFSLPRLQLIWYRSQRRHSLYQAGQLLGF